MGRGARRVGGGDRAGPGAGRNGAPPAPPAWQAGADSPVSLGLSNCPAAQAPFPETAAGTGKGGGVGGPGSRAPQRGPRSQALGLTAAPRVGKAAGAPHAGVRAQCTQADKRAPRWRPARVLRRPLGGAHGSGPGRCRRACRRRGRTGPTGAAGLGFASPTPAGGGTARLGGEEQAPGRGGAITADLCPRPVAGRGRAAWLV